MMTNSMLQGTMGGGVFADPSIEGQIKNRLVSTLTAENKQLREEITESKKKEFQL